MSVAKLLRTRIKMSEKMEDNAEIGGVTTVLQKIRGIPDDEKGAYCKQQIQRLEYIGYCGKNLLIACH